MNYKSTELKTADYGAEYFTGIRASGSDLTIGNVIGAVTPILDQQQNVDADTQEVDRPLVFVADMHAYTDQDPQNIANDRLEILKAYLALGVDPEKTDIFIQSQIGPQVMTALLALSRYVSLSRVSRIPTLKDKVSDTANASMALAQYPVMMAADIMLQRAHTVPTGKDQLAHIEFTRDLTDSVNRAVYGEKLPYCEPLTQEPVNILALKGLGKMSKTQPSTALLLSDTPKVVEKKIKGAETAIEGYDSPNLTSLLTIGNSLATSDEQRRELESLYLEHLAGERVAGRIKVKIAEIAAVYIEEFQQKRAEIGADDAYVHDVLSAGAARAKANADRTLDILQDTVTLRPYI